ncbi:MAG TPA: hypothetical protein VGP93_19665 [Polyangiaceae bacterium]|nr:hypothetical protein [Polyangiaceae bacterium]
MALASGCVASHRRDAMNASKGRGAVELQCAGDVRAWIISDTGTNGGHLYQVGVSGCGQSRSYSVLCPLNGECSFNDQGSGGIALPQ